MSEDFLHVKGGKELNDFLQQLPVKLEKNILRGAMRAGAKPIKDEVKLQMAQQSHVKTGALQAGVKVSTGVKAGRVTAKVKLTGKHAFVGKWLEFTGVKEHAIKAKNGGALFFGGLFMKTVDNPGFRAKPFMRPALDAKASSALAAAAAYIKARLTKQGLDTSDVEIDQP